MDKNQAKKNAPNPLSIKVFQDFQANIERISGQTKNRKLLPAVLCNLFLILYGFFSQFVKKAIR